MFFKDTHTTEKILKTAIVFVTIAIVSSVLYGLHMYSTYQQNQAVDHDIGDSAPKDTLREGVRELTPEERKEYLQKIEREESPTTVLERSERNKILDEAPGDTEGEILSAQQRKELLQQASE